MLLVAALEIVIEYPPAANALGAPASASATTPSITSNRLRLDRIRRLLKVVR
jgi:hypothetical protein